MVKVIQNTATYRLSPLERIKKDDVKIYINLSCNHILPIKALIRM